MDSNHDCTNQHFESRVCCLNIKNLVVGFCILKEKNPKLGRKVSEMQHGGTLKHCFLKSLVRIITF